MPKKNVAVGRKKHNSCFADDMFYLPGRKEEKKKNRDEVRSGIKKEKYWRRGQGRKKEKKIGME